MFFFKSKINIYTGLANKDDTSKTTVQKLFRLISYIMVNPIFIILYFLFKSFNRLLEMREDYFQIKRPNLIFSPLI